MHESGVFLANRSPEEGVSLPRHFESRPAIMRRKLMERDVLCMLLPILAIATLTSTHVNLIAEQNVKKTKQQKIERLFRSKYHVDFTSFKKLLGLIRPALYKDPIQAARRSRLHISPALMLQCCLRWLAGGRCHDICDVIGIGPSSFYRIIHRVIDALNDASELRPHFPTTDDELRDAAAGFAGISERGVIRHCIGAIDGWLCPIKVPRKDSCGRVVAFFSGHYQRYGLNVQACADHECRITAFCVRAPGGMNDSLAFKQWNLSQVVSRMKSPYFVVGDNAYSQRPFLMTPFNKSQVGGNIQKDSYNFYLSQLRIRVEMAFGMLVAKWGVLKSPLCVDLGRCPAVISACIRLHNFCINERLQRQPKESKRRLQADVGSFCPSVESDDTQFGRPEVSDSFGEIAREFLVQHIASFNLVRPARNLHRQAVEAQSN